MTLPALSASGFRGHLRQPEQTLGLQLKPGAGAIDWTALDNWLRDKLMLSLQPYPPGAPCAPAHTPAHAVCKLLWRILQVAAALQRAARIPVFEPGRILAWQADQTRPGVWLCEVGVAHVDYVPAQSMRLAYDAAAVLVLGVAGEPASFAAVEPLYQQLETKVLQPLRAVMPVGKSVLPLLACAHECGIPWRHLGLGIFQLGWGAHRLCIQHSKVATDSALGVAVSQDKWVAAEWLRRAGLPTPKHQLVASEAYALAAQVSLGWPLVVKPADRDRGEGVTVDIVDEAALLAAFRQARSLSSQVLVERQVSGVCHRLLVVRGEVLYTVKRWPVVA